MIGRVVQSGEVAAEPFRRHADDDVFSLVDGDRAADDVRVAAKAHLPRPMTDDRFRFGARRVIDWGEAWPARQHDAGGREIVAGHVHRCQRDRGALVRRSKEAVAAAPTGDHHTAGGVPHVQVVRIRPRVDDVFARLRPQRPARPDHEFSETIVLDARRYAEKRTHEQKDGNDDTHPKAQRRDADRGECPCLDERASRMNEVVDMANHSL